MFYDGLLLHSHLSVSDTKAIYTFCRNRQLFALRSCQPIEMVETVYSTTLSSSTKQGEVSLEKRMLVILAQQKVVLCLTFLSKRPPKGQVLSVIFDDIYVFPKMLIFVVHRDLDPFCKCQLRNIMSRLKAGFVAQLGNQHLIPLKMDEKRAIFQVVHYNNLHGVILSDFSRDLFDRDVTKRDLAYPINDEHFWQCCIKIRNTLYQWRKLQLSFEGLGRIDDNRSVKDIFTYRFGLRIDLNSPKVDNNNRDT